jgi:hypothetical protein
MTWSTLIIALARSPIPTLVLIVSIMSLVNDIKVGIAIEIRVGGLIARFLHLARRQLFQICDTTFQSFHAMLLYILIASRRLLMDVAVLGLRVVLAACLLNVAGTLSAIVSFSHSKSLILLKF